MKTIKHIIDDDITNINVQNTIKINSSQEENNKEIN